MKKVYTKPVIEIEAYTLSASIAANCSNVISMGPGVPGSTDPEKVMCDDYYDSGFLSITDPGFSIQSTNQPFYSDNSRDCDCYYHSGGTGYFTS
jgi:hypothetical protein